MRKERMRRRRRRRGEMSRREEEREKRTIGDLQRRLNKLAVISDNRFQISVKRRLRNRHDCSYMKQLVKKEKKRRRKRRRGRVRTRASLGGGLAGE